MRSKVQVRIPADLGPEIQRLLAEPWTHHEPVVFALASCATVGSQELVLVKKLVSTPEAVFLPTHEHGAKWSANWNLSLINRCVDEALGMLIIHRHDGSNVRLSGDDRASAGRLLPFFQSFVLNRIHGSIVLGNNSAAGIVWLPGETQPTEDLDIRFLSTHLKTSSRHGLPADEWGEFRRIPLAHNAINRQILSDAVVGVVGLSGGGSQIVPQLATFGVGTIIGVDPQAFDSENRFSSDVPWQSDLLMGATKTSVAGRSALLINPNCRFLPVVAEVPSKAAVDILKGADIIVGCLNNLTARSDLLELCGRYGIPYVDIGFKVALKRILDMAELSSLPGNAFTIVPGDFCLWCTGFLTEEKLRKEVGGGDRSYLNFRAGNRETEQHAHVSSFNALLSAHAATEVLQLLLGWRTGPQSSGYWVYDGISSELRRWEGERNPNCRHCNSVVHSGDPVWN